MTTSNSPTIGDVIGVLSQKAPGGANGKTLDTLKLGDPASPVRGIAVTFMATGKVIADAAKLGANLIITHEPTFYGPLDHTDWLRGDGVYDSKRSLIAEHDIAIWRFHDGPHSMRPDGIVSGIIRKLGWKFEPGLEDRNVFAIEPCKALELAKFCKERIGISMVKLAGDPQLNCRRVGILVGAYGGRAQIQLFQQMKVDAILCGESPEWETCEYVRDSVFFGDKKALIVLGHANSEEAGMEFLTEWIKTLLPPSIPVFHLNAGDPFCFI